MEKEDIKKRIAELEERISRKKLDIAIDEACLHYLNGFLSGLESTIANQD